MNNDNLIDDLIYGLLSILLIFIALCICLVYVVSFPIWIIPYILHGNKKDGDV